jgi:hypothetical protein
MRVINYRHAVGSFVQKEKYTGVILSGVQFHPEHLPAGTILLKNFAQMAFAKNEEYYASSLVDSKPESANKIQA